MAYENVTAQDYPQMLVKTGSFDSQVQYWNLPNGWLFYEITKSMTTYDNLLLLDTNVEAGHGGASGRFECYKETALEYAFLLQQEDMGES